MEQTPPIFDAHSHAFPDHVAPGAMKTLVAEAVWMKVTAHHDGTLAGLLASMDRAGVRRTIMCSVATKPTQVPKITAWSAAINCDRVCAFASIHPDYEQVEAEAGRIAAAGLRGIKFHPQYMNCAIDDPRSIRIARAAANAGLAMTYHCGYDLAYERDELAAPVQIRRLIAAVPDLRLIACHLGGWQRWEEVIEHVVGLPVWLETSYTLGQCPADLLLEILRRHPADRLLFGTDAPWADQAEELAKLRALPLPEELKRRMLWDNAAALVG